MPDSDPYPPYLNRKNGTLALPDNTNESREAMCPLNPWGFSALARTICGGYSCTQRYSE